MKISKFIISFLILSCFGYNSFSQIYSDSSVVVKSYKTNPFTEISIINKYGNIKIVQSKVDTVKFEIKIKISTNDSLNLEKFIENIDFAFTESSQKLEVTTLFKPHKTSFLPNIKDFQKLPVGENKIKIDYTVYLPEYSKLSLNNKYGNIEIDESKAELEIILSNGDLFCNILHEYISLELQFGSGKINQMKDGDLYFRYVTNFEIENVNSIKIDSKSSTIALGEVKVLKIKSKRDHLSIEEIDDFYANVFFANILIENVNNNVNSESQHSELEINHIDKDIQSFSINSLYDIIELALKKYSNFNFDICETKSKLEYSDKKFDLLQTKDSINPDMSFYKCYSPKKNNKQIKIVMTNSQLFLKRD